MTNGYVDYDEWWNDLTNEQKRGAYFAWLKSFDKSINIDEDTHVRDLTRSFDQDRFPRPKAMDEDRFKEKPMSDEDFRAWIREQGLHNPSRRYG